MNSKEDYVHPVIQPIILDDEVPLDTLSALISQNLGEPNRELIYEIISALGVDKTLQYYDKTRIIEQHGGLYCKDGSRRKKPGGVFFYLICHDSSASDCIKRIFSDEARKKCKLKKIEMKERRRRINLELKERLIKEGLLMITNNQVKDEQ